MADGLEVRGRIAAVRVLLDLDVPGRDVVVEDYGDVLVISEGHPSLASLGDYRKLVAALSRIARESFAPMDVEVEDDLELEPERNEVVASVTTVERITLDVAALPCALKEVQESFPDRIADHLNRALAGSDASVKVAATRLEFGWGLLEASAKSEDASEEDEGELTPRQNVVAFFVASAVVLATLIIVAGITNL